MVYKKKNNEESAYLQNRFTAYIVKAIRNRKRDIQRGRAKRYENELCVDFQEFACLYESRDGVPGKKSEKEATSFEEIDFRNEVLERVIWSLSERDRYVLFARILEERSYEDLGDELGLAYKGVAAVYIRAVKKIREAMEESNK